MHDMKKFLGCVYLVFTSGIAFSAHSASFDCAKVKSFAEKTICSNPKLSQDDNDLKYLYARAKDTSADQKAFSEISKALWNSRERCTDFNCVNGWYDTAFAIYGEIVKVGIPATDKMNATQEVSEPATAKKKNESLNSSSTELNKYSSYDSPDRTAPIEHDAVLINNTDDTIKFIDKLVGIVRASDYKCDSVSSFSPMIMSNGYTLSCNRFSYKYEIKDNGGHVSVTVDN